MKRRLPRVSVRKRRIRPLRMSAKIVKTSLASVQHRLNAASSLTECGRRAKKSVMPHRQVPKQRNT